MPKSDDIETLKEMAANALKLMHKLHELAGHPLSPASVEDALNTVLICVKECAYELLALERLQAIAKELDIDEKSTPDEILKELLKRKEAGTLPDSIGLIDLGVQGKDESSEPGNKDWLN